MPRSSPKRLLILNIMVNKKRVRALSQKLLETLKRSAMIEDKTGSYVELVNPLPHHVVISNIELVTGDSSKRKKTTSRSYTNWWW